MSERPEPTEKQLVDLLSKPNPDWLPRRKPTEPFRMSERDKQDFLVQQRARLRKEQDNG